MRPCRPLLLAVALAACDRPHPSPPVQYIPVAGSMKLPFSAAVRVGPLLLLSGQLGTDSTGTLGGGDRCSDPL